MLLFESLFTLLCLFNEEGDDTTSRGEERLMVNFGRVGKFGSILGVGNSSSLTQSYNGKNHDT